MYCCRLAKHDPKIQIASAVRLTATSAIKQQTINVQLFLSLLDALHFAAVYLNDYTNTRQTDARKLMQDVHRPRVEIGVFEMIWKIEYDFYDKSDIKRTQKCSHIVRLKT